MITVLRKLVSLLAQGPRRVVHVLGLRLIDRQRFKVEPRSRFDETLDELLHDPGFFFIQVGAHDGVRFDGLYQKVTAVNAAGIVIEPLPQYFARLRMNYEDYPNVLALNVALHPSEREVDIHHVKPDRLGGELPPWAGGIGSVRPRHHERVMVPADAMITTRVACTTLRQIIETYGVRRLDLLQIDAEGFDHEIIKMIPFDLIRPRLIKFEQIVLEDTARSAAVATLREHGYDVWIEGENAMAVPIADSPGS